MLAGISLVLSVQPSLLLASVLAACCSGCATVSTLPHLDMTIGPIAARAAIGPSYENTTMLSQQTCDQIADLSRLCEHTLSSPLDIDALTLAVSEQAKLLLSHRVNTLNGEEPAALYGWIEHQALQTEINLWLDHTGFDGLGTNGLSAESQKAFLTGLIQLGLPESALTCIGRGQQTEDAPALDLLRGKALSALGQPEAAISCYLALSASNPDDHTPYFHLAGEYLRLGRHADALDAFDHVISKQPTLPGPWHNKGVCLYQLENFDEAVTCFEKACELSPAFAGSWIALGKCYLSLGSLLQAQTALEHALTLGEPHAELYKTLGLTAKAQGQLETAAQYLNQALEKMPDEIGLFLARAECLVGISQYQLALQDLAKLKIIEPYNVQSCALEFECLFALQRYAEAERCYYFLQGMHPKATEQYDEHIAVIRSHANIATQSVNHVDVSTESDVCA
ncbi:tetratricopeptide repeat protein [Photobacterium nomapromontoriensis]|uniref:tetratricopeptide repeat protein n=1 Tax=Photobacterium nomapromontoriensis TaxID=2910237 RepID=UPI003D101FEA